MMNEKINKEMLQIIGESLKKVRQKNNMTIREVANELGVTQNTVVNFEKGQSNNLVLFFKYCYLFDERKDENVNENK